MIPTHPSHGDRLTVTKIHSGFSPELSAMIAKVCLVCIISRYRRPTFVKEEIQTRCRILPRNTGICLETETSNDSPSSCLSISPSWQAERHNPESNPFQRELHIHKIIRKMRPAERMYTDEFTGRMIKKKE